MWEFDVGSQEWGDRRMTRGVIKRRLVASLLESGKRMRQRFCCFLLALQRLIAERKKAEERWGKLRGFFAPWQSGENDGSKIRDRGRRNGTQIA
jgi:hypothetical protein